jgi:signal transduction histidine kinase
MAAHEMYYYSEMVSSWNNPPDTNRVKLEMNNLQMWCGIYERETTETGITFSAKQYWSNLPPEFSVEEFYTWSISPDYEEFYGINIPLRVFFGTLYDHPTTVVDNGNFLFYMVIDYIPPADIYNLIFAIIISILFIVGLYFFISWYLRPVQLMKNRIEALEEGDLSSEIDIIGEDELADLSISMNQMIKDINTLLENKHQLLLEVSHELRSPLARMQLLIAMIPEHKNSEKLKGEIDSLEWMITNLLLSDRLSLPYSKLDLKKYSTGEIIKKVKDMFPFKSDRININNHIPDEEVVVDDTKFTLAIRNLLDNAIKYSLDDQKVDFIILKSDNIEFQVKDSGSGISSDDIIKLTEPFYQANKTVSTKGFGLGLTICKKIIEAHKGHMTIKSKKGKGSIFVLHLPVIH